MDKDYIKSMELWIKEQNNLIDSMHANLDYLGKDIELKQSQISIIKEAIVHEVNYLNAQVQKLKEYKEKE